MAAEQTKNYFYYNYDDSYDNYDNYSCYHCDKETPTKINHKCYNKNCRGTGLCPIKYICTICETEKKFGGILNY